MDRRAHRRFLEYLEKHQYLGRTAVRLSRADWEAFDAEHTVLAEKEARDALTAEELTRLMAIRRALLTD